MSRIFISYRREDSAWQAGRIYDRFADRFGKESIFKDVDVIQAGDNFQKCINEAVGQCDVLLAIIGQKWLSVTDGHGQRRLDNPADWVRLEIETALNRRDVWVIPVLLDKVSMPTTQDLPVSLQPLCYRHATSVRQDPDFGRDMDYVLGIVEQRINPVRPSSSQRPLRKWFEDRRQQQNARKLFDSAIDKQSEGDNQGAIADYDKALQFNPDFADAYRNRGVVKSDLDDNQGAIADYDKALQFNPSDAYAYNNRGVAKFKLGDNQGAIADYDKALQFNPIYAPAYCNRGTAKYNLGDYLGAVADCKKAIKLAKQQGNTDYYNSAITHLKAIT